MKKIHTFGILLVMMMLLGSCVTSRAGFSNEQLLGIHKGMTLEQVTEILGKPTHRSFDDEGEEWEFRALGFSGWSVVRVLFVDSRVTKMKSYLENEGECHHSTDNNKID